MVGGVKGWFFLLDQCAMRGIGVCEPNGNNSVDRVDRGRSDRGKGRGRCKGMGMGIGMGRSLPFMSFSRSYTINA